MSLSSYVLLATGSLFAILSPLGTVPTFLALTEGDSAEDRVSMARRACTVAFVVMAAFSLFGSSILGSFAVGVPALQIAGGIVILRVGLEMMAGSRQRLTPAERAEGASKDDVAVTPLAVPVLCGPGVITTGIVLESQAEGALQVASLLAIEAAVFALTYALLWAAARYSVFFGQIALRVVGRLMGLLLATIAVQFVLNGARGAFPGVFG
ncbi:MAG TPA: MarC family protein [Myxococcota bacterium]|nr:MarC family protein [Myxococcota bacterium]